MKALLESWKLSPHLIKDKWFRPGLYSEFRVRSVRCRRNGSYELCWNYTWMDFGLCHTEDRVVVIEPDDGGWACEGRRCKDLEGLESVVFEGVWAQLQRGVWDEIFTLDG